MSWQDGSDNAAFSGGLEANRTAISTTSELSLKDIPFSVSEFTVKPNPKEAIGDARAQLLVRQNVESPGEPRITINTVGHIACDKKVQAF